MVPTGLDVCQCEKGAYWHRVCIHGESAHGSQPRLETNAIDIAVEVITVLNAQTFADLNEHEILGQPTVNIGRIEGGDNINTVPERCMFEVDRQIVPAEDMMDIVDETAAIVANITQNYDFTYEVEKMVTASPFEIPCDAVVQVARAAIERVIGTPPAISGTSGYTGARFPAVQQGKPTIILGSGDNAASHVANEYIDLRYLERAPRVLPQSPRSCFHTELSVPDSYPPSHKHM